MPKLTPPLTTPLVGTQLITADPWQKYFTNLYREGEWTPVLAGSAGTSGQTYSVQTGRWVKVGRVVTLTGHLGLSAKGTIAGGLLVAGLPFVSERHAAGVPYWVGSVGWTGLALPVATITGLLQPGDTRLLLYGAPSGGTTAEVAMDTTYVTNTTALVVSLGYLAQD